MTVDEAWRAGCVTSDGDRMLENAQWCVCDPSIYHRHLWNVTNLILDRQHIFASTLLFSDDYSDLVSSAHWPEMRLVDLIQIIDGNKEVELARLLPFRQRRSLILALSDDLIIGMYQQAQLLSQRYAPELPIIVLDTRLAVLADTILFRDHTLMLEPAFNRCDCILHECSNISESITIWAPSLMSEQMEEVGSWNIQQGLMLPADPWTFTEFKNKTFTVTLAESAAFIQMVRVSGGHAWEGICLEMLKSLASDLNFTYNLVVPPDGSWGSVDENGTPTGMVGMVSGGEADFGVGPFTMTPDRDSVIDFTVPFYFTSSVFLMPKSEDVYWLSFLGQFRYDLWVLIIFTIPVCALVYGTALYLISEIIMPPSQVSKKAAPTSYITKTSFFTFGACLAQGSFWEPRSWTMRLMVIFWWFFAIMMDAVYTGNLTASLAVPQTSSLFDSLEDLANQDEYQVGVKYGTALQSVFKESTDEIYRKIWDQSMHKPENTVADIAEGLQKVRSEKFVYVTEHLPGVLSQFNTCNIVMGEKSFLPTSFAFVFPEKSPYLPIFNSKIERMFESGLIDHWTKEYSPADKCDEGTTVNGAVIQEVQGMFLVLLFGASVSAVVLALECCVKKWTAQSRDHMTSSTSQARSRHAPRTDVNSDFEITHV